MDISFTSSLYKTDKHISAWKKRLLVFAGKAKKLGLSFEIIAVSNEPSAYEKNILTELAENEWFKFVEVPRETIYESWNRGTKLAQANACTFWNVDDDRFPEAIVDGLQKIREASKVTTNAIVYFPFIYKRYINALGIKILARKKRIVSIDYDKTEFMRSMWSGPFFMFTKSTYEKIGDFDPQYRVGGDFEWSARAAQSDILFLKSDIDAGIFTNDGTTLSGSQSVRHLKEMIMVYEKYGATDKASSAKEQLKTLEAKKTA